MLVGSCFIAITLSNTTTQSVVFILFKILLFCCVRFQATVRSLLEHHLRAQEANTASSAPPPRRGPKITDAAVTMAAELLRLFVAGEHNETGHKYLSGPAIISSKYRQVCHSSC